MYSPLQINRNKGSLDRRFDRAVSLLETNEGDFFVSNTGDLLPASPDESIAQTLLAAVRTTFDTSPIFPSFGTKVKSLGGKAITIKVLEDTKKDLLSDLVNMGFIVYENLLEVLAFDKTTIIISVVVKGVNTPRISLSYRLDTNDLTIEQLGGVVV